MSREAMQMALEALESDPISHAGLVNRKRAITALRQALETEQEPVAWITNGGKGELWWHQSSKFDEEGNLIGPNPDDIPLYTAPRDSDNTAQRTVDKIKGREMTTMDDAIAAGDGVLMNEQAALLRECRMALDHLLRDKPMLAAKVCGTTTLGNLRAMLHEYRPQGVFGDDIIRIAREVGIDELRQALETEQEPVLWLKTWFDESVSALKTKSYAFADRELEPLYTAPPKQWVGLTDEQVEDEWERITGHGIFGGDRSEGRAMYISPDEVIEFSRSIEAKLKGKNHG